MMNEFVLNEENLKLIENGACQFGDYALVDEGDIESAKEQLMQGLFATMSELAKLDKFWIVHKGGDFPFVPEGKVSVAWKIEVPQFIKPKKGKWVEVAPGEFKRE